MRNRIATIAALVGLCLSAPLVAQNPGDLIMSMSGATPGVYFGAFKQPLQKMLGGNTQCVQVAIERDEVLVGAGGLAPRIYRIDAPGGVITTIAQLPSGVIPNDMAPVQQGGYFVAMLDGSLQRINNQDKLLPRTTYPVALSSIALDLRNGGYLATSATGSNVLAIDVTNMSLKTLPSPSPGGTLTAIEVLPSGTVAIGSLKARGLQLSSMLFSANLSIPSVNALASEPHTDTLWVGTTFGTVYQVRGATIVSSHSYGATFNITGIDVWSSRKVRVTQDLGGNKNYTVSMMFRRSPSAPYCVAASLRSSPGIALPGNQRLYLGPDALFFATASQDIPGITNRFSGMTSVLGEATANITIPSGIGNLDLYVSAVALNPTLPGNLDVGNTDMVRYRPAFKLP